MHEQTCRLPQEWTSDRCMSRCEGDSQQCWGAGRRGRQRCTWRLQSGCSSPPSTSSTAPRPAERACCRRCRGGPSPPPPPPPAASPAAEGPRPPLVLSSATAGLRSSPSEDRPSSSPPSTLPWAQGRGGAGGEAPWGTGCLPASGQGPSVPLPPSAAAAVTSPDQLKRPSPAATSARAPRKTAAEPLEKPPARRHVQHHPRTPAAPNAQPPACPVIRHGVAPQAGSVGLRTSRTPSQARRTADHEDGHYGHTRRLGAGDSARDTA